jgi:transcriptional regulator with XRE-family HTH domain
MKQTAISRLESGNAGLPNIDTLLRIAKSFDCGLIVRFAPFSEILRWSDGIGHRGLVAPSFEEDAAASSAYIEEKTTTGNTSGKRGSTANTTLWEPSMTDPKTATTGG